jgi:hypothetical protein
MRVYLLDVRFFFSRETYNVTEHSIVMGGHRIHGLLLSTFEVRDFKCFACMGRLYNVPWAVTGPPRGNEPTVIFYT